MDALALLRLQIEWGADEALAEESVNRLRPVPAAIRAAPVPSGQVGAAPIASTPLAVARPSRSVVAALPGGTPAERAIRAAAEADTLEALKATIMAFEGCPLRDMATNVVFAAGDPTSGLMLIGGPPAADEDRSGTPFSGKEGALLDQMLASIGLTRGTMLLTPLIPWRPPGGRVPNPGELQLYRPFLMRLITLTAPNRIVLLGALAASTVLGGGHRTRGVAWIDTTIEGRQTQVLVLPSLTDLTRTPSRRKAAWAGLRLLRRAIDTGEA